MKQVLAGATSVGGAAATVFRASGRTNTVFQSVAIRTTCQPYRSAAASDSSCGSP